MSRLSKKAEQAQQAMGQSASKITGRNADESLVYDAKGVEQWLAANPGFLDTNDTLLKKLDQIRATEGIHSLLSIRLEKLADEVTDVKQSREEMYEVLMFNQKVLANIMKYSLALMAASSRPSMIEIFSDQAQVIFQVEGILMTPMCDQHADMIESFNQSTWSNDGYYWGTLEKFETALGMKLPLKGASMCCLRYRESKGPGLMVFVSDQLNKYREDRNFKFEYLGYIASCIQHLGNRFLL